MLARTFTGVSVSNSLYVTYLRTMRAPLHVPLYFQEKRALERKISEYEEELKVQSALSAARRFAFV